MTQLSREELEEIERKIAKWPFGREIGQRLLAHIKSSSVGGEGESGGRGS